MTDSFAQLFPAARVFLEALPRNSGVADLMPWLMLHGCPKCSGTWQAPAPPLTRLSLQQADRWIYRQYPAEIAQLSVGWAAEQVLRS